MNEIFDPRIQAQNVESRIVVALERISEVFRVLLWKEAKKYKLSPIQLQILLFLKYHKPALRKVSPLALEFNVTKATVSDAIKVLVNKRLLSKTPEENDARSSILDLSPEGETIAQKLTGFAAEIAAPLQESSDAEKQTLLDTLLKMIHTLHKDGIIQTQRMCYTCRHYSQNAKGHYCALLETALKQEELRLDCPEHEV